jgi:hypothetical protein
MRCSITLPYITLAFCKYRCIELAFGCRYHEKLLLLPTIFISSSLTTEALWSFEKSSQRLCLISPSTTKCCESLKLFITWTFAKLCHWTSQIPLNLYMKCVRKFSVWTRQRISSLPHRSAQELSAQRMSQGKLNSRTHVTAAVSQCSWLIASHVRLSLTGLLRRDKNYTRVYSEDIPGKSTWPRKNERHGSTTASVLWNVAPCNLAVYLHFRGTFRLHYQGNQLDSTGHKRPLSLHKILFAPFHQLN